MTTTFANTLSPTSLGVESLQGTGKKKSSRNVINNGNDASLGRRDAEGYGGEINQKEFFWDQFLIYMATLIALLTVLDVTLQFFRGGGLSCRLPPKVPLNPSGNETFEPTRDEAAFVNTFCQQSLSRAEYFPLFVLIQGLVLAAPHYLWAALYGGEFDFFFGLVQQLDRLRDSTTGQYRSQNFDIVDKLEKHFPQKWKPLGIFSLYVIKLNIQLLVILSAIIINGTVFQTKYFAFSFTCPQDFDPESPLPYNVTCVFASFRLHQTIQIINYLLLFLGLIAAASALVWCFTRHSIALGFRDIALFAFSSCLRPEEYVHSSYLKPHIQNDLDFLLLRLFQADSGYGKVFKDIQVQKELKKEVGKDHEYLYILLDVIKERERAKRRIPEQQAQQDTTSSMQQQQDISRLDDIRNCMSKAKFNSNPENIVYGMLSREGILGSAKWTERAGIRDFIYGFFSFAGKTKRLALDISFGTIGYSLILARAFQEVISLNFHPFYANEEEICRKDEFHTNYSTLTFREDIFATRRESLRKVDETLGSLFRKDRGKGSVQANLIMVGPFTEEAKAATVNLFIERQQAADRFADKCILLSLRPLRIGTRNTSAHFCKFKPQTNLFEEDTVSVENKLREDKIMVARVGEYKGIPMECGKTDCIIEITLYRYCGHQKPKGQIEPTIISPKPQTTVGSVALIVPSHVLSVVQQKEFQRFLGGEGAIKLYASSFTNPLEFSPPGKKRRPINVEREEARLDTTEDDENVV